ncbi:MAG: hypothetical protein K6T65_16515 [Peptococcaceae bacterium]|nr:hypothetical protein [Peptococcaceae bacterium]
MTRLPTPEIFSSLEIISPGVRKTSEISFGFTLKKFSSGRRDCCQAAHHKHPCPGPRSPGAAAHARDQGKKIPPPPVGGVSAPAADSPPGQCGPTKRTSVFYSTFQPISTFQPFNPSAYINLSVHINLDHP